MTIEIINKKTADRYYQAKKYGIIGEGCNGVWGTGDTISEATADALAHILNVYGYEIVQRLEEKLEREPDADEIENEILKNCSIMELVA